MKKFRFLAVALVALTLISCSKKDDNNGDVPDGTPIFASLAIDFGESKADTDAGVDQEKLYPDNKVDVLVYSNGVLETVAADLAQTTGKTTEFKTTTGAKTIVAIINRPTGVNLPGINTTIAALYTLQATLATGDIAATQKFTMSGVKEETLAASTTGTGPTIAITVSRLTAKVVLIIADAIVPGGDLALSSTTFAKVGETDAPEFALKQTQKLANIFADPAITPAITDPGAVSGTPSVYANIESGTTFNYVAAQKDLSAMPFATSRYCPVNFNATPTIGNLTFAAIKLKLTPAKKMVVDPTSGNVSYADHAFSGDFFGFVHPTTKVTYAPFTTDTEAAAAYDKLTSGSGGAAAVKTWTAGMAYYKIYVGDKRTDALKFGVLANRVYQVNVSSISGFGVSADEELVDPDPEIPIETNAHITAQITVAPWDVVFFSEGIR